MENPNLQLLLSQLVNLKPQSGNELWKWTSHCPLHEAGPGSHSNSLSIGHDDSTGQITLKCHGCSEDSRKLMLAAGFPASALYIEKPKPKLVASYVYTDMEGNKHQQVRRYEEGEGKARKKKFSQHEWNKKTGNWNKVAPKIVYPYRLERILKADPETTGIILAEGEKSVDFSQQEFDEYASDKKQPVSFIVTCLPGGATANGLPGHILDIFAPFEVVVIGDNDKPNAKTGIGKGQQHAKRLATDLHNVASEVQLVESLPGVKVKGGLDDWLQVEKPSHNVAGLLELIKFTAIFEPDPEDLKVSEDAELQLHYCMPEFHNVNKLIDRIAKDDWLYVYRGALAEVLDGDIVVIKKPRLRSISSLYCSYVNNKAETTPGAPNDYIASFFDRQRWPEFPELDGMVDYPILRPDGTIVQKDGYDQASRMILNINREFPAIPDNPTREDAMKSLATLRELVSDFCFASEVDESCWLAMQLTPIARSAYTGPTGPAYMVNGNSPAVGKGLIAWLTHYIACGTAPPAAVWPDGTYSQTQELTSLLLNNPGPMISFDNVVGKITGPALEAFLTGEVYQQRILGGNQSLTCEPKCVTMFTGNGLIAYGDSVRRVCEIKLKDMTGDPGARQSFKHPDLKAHVIENRDKYLAAALTILRAYIVAGKPKSNIPPWASFDGWSDMVRHPIAWLGMPDPFENREDTASRDGRANGLALLCEALEPYSGKHEHGLSSREILAKATDRIAYNSEAENLTEAIELLTDKDISEVKAKSLTMALEQFADRLCGDVQFKIVEGRARRKSYKIRPRKPQIVESKMEVPEKCQGMFDYENNDFTSKNTGIPSHITLIPES